LLLGARLPAEARQALESHLLSCPGCRDRLDDLAGGAGWWAQVRQNLADDAASSDCPTSDQAISPGAAAGDLGFLKPSDDPASLGRLGSYEVREVLGHGGMGVVLRAFDPALHRPGAIKGLAAQYAVDGTARRRFAREARAAAAVAHDHVVAVYAVDAEATPPYLVMALVAGQSLQQRIDRAGPLRLEEVLRIGMQAASGLAAAPAPGLIPRGIKPANPMLGNGIEPVRITDFGPAPPAGGASAPPP